MAGRKRRDSGPMAAPAEPNKRASDTTSQLSDEKATQCVASKLDPELWDTARYVPTEALKTEIDPERRRNIEACLNYINENGYPQPDEVFMAMDGVVKHITEREFRAMDWVSLKASGKKDKAFLMVSSHDYPLPGLVLFLLGSNYYHQAGPIYGPSEDRLYQW
jgi:hypothetical protein